MVTDGLLSCVGRVLLQVESRLAWAEVRVGQGPDREHRLYLGVWPGGRFVFFLVLRPTLAV